MIDDGSDVEVYQKLRLLSVTDPKSARILAESILDQAAPQLEGLLQRLSHPAEGRLRHVFALAARRRPENRILIHHLLRWQRTETDEFARKALASVLQGIDPATFNAAPTTTDLPEILTTYRYVASRLSHRVRNLLPDVNLSIRRLSDQVQAIPGADIRNECLNHLQGLREAIRRVGAEVEFDQGDEYFRWNQVNLKAWLNDMTSQYNRRYRPLRLHYASSVRTPCVVNANDYLLELIFWNLWKNAQQEIGDNCAISIEESVHGTVVELAVIDNGPGFDRAQAETFFKSPFTTRDSHSGLGLLEVQDAVSRLHGTIGLREIEGALRMVIAFPVVLT